MKQMKKRFILKRHLLTLTIIFLLLLNSLVVPDYCVANDPDPTQSDSIYSIIPLPKNIHSNTSVLSLD